jgi:hypothetical protein
MYGFLYTHSDLLVAWTVAGDPSDAVELDRLLDRRGSQVFGEARLADEVSGVRLILRRRSR